MIPLEEIEATVDYEGVDPSIGEQIRKILNTPTPSIDTQPSLGADDASDDEIVEALRRQTEALRGTATALLVLAKTVLLQADGIQAELDLFSTPAANTVNVPRVEVERTPSGALVEASLPEEKRLPDFCTHADALIIDTVDGKVRVCPDCAEQ